MPQGGRLEIPRTSEATVLVAAAHRFRRLLERAVAVAGAEDFSSRVRSWVSEDG